MTAIKRLRLSPAVRREQLLDTAKEIIVVDGLQQLSMKVLASQARVSEQLPFRYFSSRVDLLQQLLVRDYGRFGDAVVQAVGTAASLSEIIRMYVNMNFEHHSMGNIIAVLSDQPEVVVAIVSQKEAHQRFRRRFLVNAVAKDYGLTREDAEMVTTMASSASIAAASYAHERGVDREQAVARVLQFIFAGFESARK
jgi:AcrR family transcriptional regulator